MLFYDEELIFPSELSDALESSFAEDRNRFTAKELSRVGAQLSKLWPLLAKKRGFAEKHHYSFDHAHAHAYAAYYLAANLMKWPCVLDEIDLLSKFDSSPTRICDFGCGPGTVLWGSAWWHAKTRRSLEYVGVEQSKQFIDIATKASRALVNNLPRNTVHAKWLEKRLDKNSILQTIRAERPTLVTFSNSLAEIAETASDRHEVLVGVADALTTLTESDGQPRRIVVLEPASLAASRELIELRNSFLTKNASFRMELPCLDNRPCGALAREGDWCHEEVSMRFPEWMNALGKNAGLKKENLLFSYLVLSNSKSESLLKGFDRVVSHRFKEKGLVRCWICTKNGKKQIRLLNARKNETNEQMESIRRGDIIKNLELSEKGDVLSLLLFRDFD